MRADFKARLQAILQAIEPFEPKRVILFGSRARGDATLHSDIDLAFEGVEGFRKRRKLQEAIDEASGLYSVDIVFIEDINQKLKEVIEKEGTVIYERED